MLGGTKLPGNPKGDEKRRQIAKYLEAPLRGGLLRCPLVGFEVYRVAWRYIAFAPLCGMGSIPTFPQVIICVLLLFPGLTGLVTVYEKQNRQNTFIQHYIVCRAGRM